MQQQPYLYPARTSSRWQTHTLISGATYHPDPDAAQQEEEEYDCENPSSGYVPPPVTEIVVSPENVQEWGPLLEAVQAQLAKAQQEAPPPPPPAPTMEEEEAKGARLLRLAGYGGQGGLGKHGRGIEDPLVAESTHIGGHGGLGFSNVPKRQRHQHNASSLPSLDDLVREVRWTPEWLSSSASGLRDDVLAFLSATTKPAPGDDLKVKEDLKEDDRYRELCMRLNQCKGLLDTVDSRQLHDARTRALVFEHVGHHQKSSASEVNRAKLKLVELDAAADGELVTVAQPGYGPFSVVELCGAPGGWLRYMIEKLQWRMHVTAMSLQSEKGLRYKLPLGLLHGMFEDFPGSVATPRPGDITHAPNIWALRDHVAKFTKAHLVTADGAADSDANHKYNEQEALNEPILRHEIAAALGCLRPGGILILKCFTLFHLSSRCLLFLLYALFHRVSLVQLTRSRASNSEWYVWAEGYSPSCSENQTLNTALLEALIGPEPNPSFMAFLAQRMARDDNFQNYVDAAIQYKTHQQLVALEQIVRCIEDPTYLATDSSMANLQRSAAEICQHHWAESLDSDINSFLPRQCWDVQQQFPPGYFRTCSREEKVHYGSVLCRYPYWTATQPPHHHDPSRRKSGGVRDLMAERHGIEAWRAVLLPRLLTLCSSSSSSASSLGFLLATESKVWWIQTQHSRQGTVSTTCTPCVIGKAMKANFLPADTLLECSLHACQRLRQNIMELQSVTAHGYWFLPYHAHPILTALLRFNRHVPAYLHQSALPSAPELVQSNPPLLAEFVQYVGRAYGTAGIILSA